MTLFRVWAPLAESVELQLNDGRRRMAAGEGGWWVLDVPAAGAGTDYAYVVDGEGPFPDPRSPWQPNGVHAASRVVDHDAFAWQHDDWPRTPLSQAIIYELHIGTFTPQGTFDGAVDKLDYLVELGVTHVELMPVAQFPGDRGWGYDGVDLFAPHQAYGGPDGLKRLVDACHGRGLRVLMDVVYNHFGPSGNYLERFGPYFTERYHTPWGKAINYDQAHADEVRRFAVDNALMWLRDYRCDGLRLDAIHAILDQSALHILEAIAAAARDLERETGRDYDVIAESDLNDPRLVMPVAQGGYGLDGAWSDDFHHAVHALLTGERAGYYEDFGSIAGLADALKHVYVYRGAYSRYRKRAHGRPLGDLPAWRFVFAIQNHDQVGNRAKGDRLVHLAGIAQGEGRGGAAAHGAGRAAAVPGRGVGGILAVSVLHRPPGAGAGARGQRGPQARVRRLRLVARRSAGPPGRRDLRALPARLAGARPRAAPRDAELVPRPDRAAPRDARPDERPPRRGRDRVRRGRRDPDHAPRRDHARREPGPRNRAAGFRVRATAAQRRRRDAFRPRAASPSR